MAGPLWKSAQFRCRLIDLATLVGVLLDVYTQPSSLSLSLLDIFRERVINAIRFHSVGIQDGEQTIQSSLRKLAIRDGLKTSKKEVEKVVFWYLLC